MLENIGLQRTSAAMEKERTERHLSAILAADVVGYSRLMEQDEGDTFARLTAHRRELFEPEIEKYHGHIFKLMGDGILAEFASVIDAVECAVVLQRGLRRRNEGLSNDKRIDIRIGITLGDVILEGEDRHGEGVIIANRLQGLADPGGIYISQHAYDQIGTKLDLSYEDLGEHMVKNIVKAVHVYRIVDGKDHALRRPSWARSRKPTKAIALTILVAAFVLAGVWYQFSTANALPPLPKGPKIAVLPFTNVGGVPQDAYFADGLTEDITTALSKFSELFVFPLAATIQHKGESVDPRTVGRELNARYVLEGNVTRSKNHLRVGAQLLDARDARLIWSNTYDRDLTAADVFAVLDKIATSVVATIDAATGVVWATEAKNLHDKETDSLEAYNCVVLAISYQEDFAPSVRTRARKCLERAVKLDPNYSRAWSRLSEIYVETYKNEKSRPGSPDYLALADAAARRAIELDKQNDFAYYNLAIVTRLRGESYDTFKALADKALAINPNRPEAVGDIGNFTFYSGHWERGKALVERMMQLNPHYPSWAHFVLFLDHYRKAEYPEALTEAIQINLPKHCMIQWAQAAAYGQVGEIAKAKAVLAHIATIEPPCPGDPRDPFAKRGLPAVLVESVMDGLRKGGLAVPPATQ